MPITPFLNGQKFDAETRRVLGVAFEIVCVALRTGDCDNNVKQCIANQIIELANDGERNPDVLSERALKLIRGESASWRRAQPPVAKVSINDPKHWRERAEGARTLADQMEDQEDARRKMLRIADDYEELARRAERRLKAGASEQNRSFMPESGS
jgi:hypothetical protein